MSGTGNEASTSNATGCRVVGCMIAVFRVRSEVVIVNGNATWRLIGCMNDDDLCPENGNAFEDCDFDSGVAEASDLVTGFAIYS